MEEPPAAPPPRPVQCCLHLEPVQGEGCQPQRPTNQVTGASLSPGTGAEHGEPWAQNPPSHCGSLSALSFNSYKETVEKTGQLMGE